MKTIYTLHEYGAESHFCALVEFAKQNEYKIRHYEVKQRKAIRNLIKKFDFHFFENLIFFINLLFTSNKKVVLAVAPYNKLLPKLMYLLRKHEVYYFTSYTIWDQSNSVHNLNGSEKLLEQWKYFTNTFVKHIFAVSNKTKTELIKNGFAAESRISIVNHSLRENIIAGKQNMNLTFIQVATLSQQKGTLEILDVFKNDDRCSITLAGRGNLSELAIKEASMHDNINYLGYIESFRELVSVYKQHSFVLLNSLHIKDSVWEELFGIAIIEGMASGCVPVATMHPGPMEIIENGVNGILYKEGDLAATLEKIKAMTPEEYDRLRNNSIASGRQYFKSNMANRWSKILLHSIYCM